ncbi:ATP synthase A1 subunit C [Candidatus Woesearchaeota archaeon]|nr:ATP synthase A1 subunit C [Candidatus Woesearchaeota archaeon]
MEQRTLLQEEKPRSIRLGQAPYTYARVAVMRSKLVKRDDYSRLMKMKVSEITKFLQETEYKKEIDEMAVNYSGVELVELALNRNLVRNFQKLKRIAEYEGLRLVMQEYMKRRDIWNLKTILRGKFSGQDENSIKDMLIPVGLLSEPSMDALLKKESVDEIINEMPYLSKEAVKEASEYFREHKSLFAAENLLDRAYYTNALDFSRRIKRQGIVFREFIEEEVDVVNVKAILRLKKQGMKKQDIISSLIPSGTLSHSDIEKLSGAEDLDSAVSMLDRMGYAKILKDAYDKSKKDISEIERRLNKSLLDKTILLLHTHPLSVDVILGYMFAKDIEIKNIRTIIKAKQLGIDDEFVQKELVIGG